MVSRKIKFNHGIIIFVSNIPTNIITGFLGAGKTSAILHLLKHKPRDERWAVIVNEFGEIGVDGSLFEGQTKEEQGIFIREVPGGCMCCTAGISLQRALNIILTKVKPDRLLIEPTGLGHPTEVIQTLKFKKYRNKLSVKKVITIVDARLISLDFYAEHSIFNEQIAIADLIVGNKSDLYKEKDKLALFSYAKKYANTDIDIIISQQGIIDPQYLQEQSVTKQPPSTITMIRKQLILELLIPESGYIKRKMKEMVIKVLDGGFQTKILIKINCFSFFFMHGTNESCVYYSTRNVTLVSKDSLNRTAIETCQKVVLIIAQV